MLARNLRRTLFGLAILALSGAVWSGLHMQRAQAAARTPNARTTAAAAAVQQLRCWQHGRMIFEESDVLPPAESLAYVLRLDGSDGRSLYLADTRNATCLIGARPVGGTSRAGTDR